MQQKSSVHAFLPFRPPKYAALALGRGTGVVRPKAGAYGVLSGSLSEGISWVILAFFVGCVKAGGSGARCAARGGGAGWWRGVSVVARRDEVPLAGCSGGCFQRFTPRGALAAARRDGALLANGPGGRFPRFTPRGLLRWRGVRGALRPLFLLRSCAADQEKRPEKKSWAVTVCAPVQPERLWNTCIRSAPRCISRGQREEGFFWLRGKGFGAGFWELGLWSLCCAVGL